MHTTNINIDTTFTQHTQLSATICQGFKRLHKWSLKVYDCDVIRKGCWNIGFSKKRCLVVINICFENAHDKYFSEQAHDKFCFGACSWQKEQSQNICFEKVTQTQTHDHTSLLIQTTTFNKHHKPLHILKHKKYGPTTCA